MIEKLIHLCYDRDIPHYHVATKNNFQKAIDNLKSEKLLRIVCTTTFLINLIVQGQFYKIIIQFTITVNQILQLFDTMFYPE